MIRALIRIMGRVPCRAHSHPVIGIEITDPIPRHRSNRPKAASSTPVLALAKGMIGAQEAKDKPFAINAMRVAFAADLSDPSVVIMSIPVQKFARRYPLKSAKVND
jgi:hypothetical protein